MSYEDRMDAMSDYNAEVLANCEDICLKTASMDELFQEIQKSLKGLRDDHITIMKELIEEYEKKCG